MKSIRLPTWVRAQKKSKPKQIDAIGQLVALLRLYVFILIMFGIGSGAALVFVIVFHIKP